MFTINNHLFLFVFSHFTVERYEYERYEYTNMLVFKCFGSCLRKILLLLFKNLGNWHFYHFFIKKVAHSIGCKDPTIIVHIFMSKAYVDTCTWVSSQILLMYRPTLLIYYTLYRPTLLRVSEWLLVLNARLNPY